MDDDDMRGEKGLIEPDWDRKFNVVWTQTQLKNLVDSFCADYQYYSEDIQTNGEKAIQLATRIRDHLISSGKLRRYKLNVQAFIGEKKDQKVTIVAKGFWDNYVDNYSTYTFSNDCFYCTVIAWGFYSD